MPIIFSGDQLCEKCNMHFNWSYFELRRQNISSSDFSPEPFPVNVTLAHHCQQIDDDYYLVQVNCPYCDYDNHFRFHL